MLIEISGLPRSGKSTSVSVIRDVLVRSGYSVRLNEERAQACPFSTRYRVEFATWMANQAINNVLEAKRSLGEDVIFLQDRGIFDALGFIRLLELEDKVDESTFHKLAEYVGYELWTRFVDLVIILQVTPEVAISRDLAAIIYQGPATITNEKTLQKLDKAYTYIQKHYGDRFPKIVTIDTTNNKPLDTARHATEAILQLL